MVGEKVKLHHGLRLDRERCLSEWEGEREGERERAGGALVEMVLELTCGACGGTWRPSPAGLIRT